MVREIYKKRYGKALLALLILIVGAFLLSGFSAVRSWHSDQTWLHSSEHKKQFQESPEIYYYVDEKGNDKEETLTFEESVELASYFFQGNYGSDSLREFLRNTSSGKNDPATDYYSAHLGSNGIVIISIIAFSGFLLFFVDQKTAFNRFLFSLPVSRRQLFCGKLLYIGLPLLAAFLGGSLLLVTALKLGIPAPYMNADWSELLNSVGISFMTCLFAFLISCFIGAMVGNLVFGPLIYLVFMWSLLILPQGISQTVDLIEMLKNGVNYSADGSLRDFSRIFTFDVGKSSGSFLMSFIPVLISLLCLFWAYRKYQTLSLEHDGEFLLYPESRWPIWFVMTFYMSYCALTIFNPIWNTYVYSNLMPDVDSEIMWRYPLSHAVGNTLFILLAAAICATLLLFFGQIRRFLSEKWEAHLEKRTLKSRG